MIFDQCFLVDPLKTFFFPPASFYDCSSRLLIHYKAAREKQYKILWLTRNQSILAVSLDTLGLLSKTWPESFAKMAAPAPKKVRI